MTDSHPSPRIELLPLRAALPAGQDSEVTVLARIHPAPAPRATAPRPPLNLCLVIDRSGSMDGPALAMARRATQVAIRALQPHDRVGVVAFDDEVTTVVPSQLVTDPERLVREVEGIAAGGMTALHRGWLEGAMQSAQHIDAQAINRVILLSDGQANQGEVRPQVIAEQVRGLAQRGVGTSTIGLGRDYDEHLLQAMAEAGDGNYEHIEDAEALPAYFQAELQGLTRTTAHTVSLGVEPNPALSSRRVEILNDLPLNPLRRSQLPNLIDGHPTEVVFTVQVPAQFESPDLGITRVRLAWTGRDGVRRRMRAQLNLPVVPPTVYEGLPDDPQVRVPLERLRAARVREQAVAYATAGQVHASRAVLADEHVRLRAFADELPLLAEEAATLQALNEDFGQDEQLARKRATSQSYKSRRTR
ncbi:vWA domain-containing protein [Deinococcus hohokamensis]|uniref:VWA domain-containing protein n=1 Tax=Deinococcus hohokamensis TaxID=309883 RepID=A0ABV9ICX0_9DEIO